MQGGAGRMALAAGVSGLTLVAGGMTSAWLIELPASFARFGVQPSAATALLHTGLRMGLGVAAVLLYSSLVRVHGAGTGTAIRTALFVWYVGYVPGSVVLHELGALDASQLTFALVWGLAEVVVATLIGGRLCDAGDRGA